MTVHELRPLIVATILLTVALIARGIPAREQTLTLHTFCEQLLREQSGAKAIVYSPCVPPQ